MELRLSEYTLELRNVSPEELRTLQGRVYSYIDILNADWEDVQ